MFSSCITKKKNKSILQSLRIQNSSHSFDGEGFLMFPVLFLNCSEKLKRVDNPMQERKEEKDALNGISSFTLPILWKFKIGTAILKFTTPTI